MKTAATSGPARGKVRFTPGSMLGDRYRIVALLGKGGMGEVYRADDIRLGQQVALKFLPSHFTADPENLQRLYEEVRLGRQVSHPNVCRIYDLVEVDGHHFIAMEYIDGEDLASLVRRIGRLPQEKALDLARDLCAGLAAAHALGIVHRDLKPANVMIDGRGDARITDFGLAVLAEDLEARREIAGTPAYMAPEQLSGGEVSHKTDLYALGLILYEIFTGKRLFTGDTFGEVVSQHSVSNSQSVSRETAALDASVQRVIVRCLEPEPADRPGSIHSVIAALPGGDPLQAAIEAGETPSPEMIAAAGSSGELRPSVAWPLLILTLLVVLGAATLAPRVRLYGQTDLPLEGRELAVLARHVVASAGLKDRPRDTAWEFSTDSYYLRWKRERRGGAAPSDSAEAIFSPVLFSYRESASEMTYSPGQRVYGGVARPALDVGGMAQVFLQPDGRLRRLILVPPEELPQGAPLELAPDWAPLLRATGFDAGAMKSTEPRWRSPVGSDRRFAWLAPMEGLRDPVRVEAASLAGQPVWLEVFPPWRRPRISLASALTVWDRLTALIAMILILSALVVGILLAIRNSRRGRGNRQGAWRLGAFVAVSILLTNAFHADHFADPALELAVVLYLLAFAALWGGMTWIWYLALEPYLRRRWPRTLISWNRILQQQWLDPLIGRDLLIGVLAGAASSLIAFMALALPGWLGRELPVSGTRLLMVSGWIHTLSDVFDILSGAVIMALGWMLVLLLAHLLFRRRWLAVAVLAVIMTVMGPGTPETYPLLVWASRALVAAVAILVTVRYGLLALAALTVTKLTFNMFPVTLDPAVWYFDRSLLGLTLIAGLAVFGFVRALGTESLFGQAVLED